MYIVDIVDFFNTIEILPVNFQYCFNCVLFIFLTKYTYRTRALGFVVEHKTQALDSCSFGTDRFNIVNQSMVFLPIFRRFLMI